MSDARKPKPVQPPPHPKRRQKTRGGFQSGKGPQWLSGRNLAIGGGLLCLLLVVFGLAALMGLFRPSSTTAADYTTSEVQEIIRLLREDPECRDTRIGDYFASNTNSLELWEKVLGKPSAVVGRKNSPDWTFSTQDGAISVHVGVDYHSGKIPFVESLSNGEASFGLRANEPVDSKRLKTQILHIKRQIDPRDSLAFQKELAEKWEKERAAEEAERRRRDEEEQRRQDELYALRKAEREAEKARRLEGQRQQDAKVTERRVLLDSQRQAEREYYNIRDNLPVGPEKDLFVEQHQEWVAGRIEAITSARAKDQDWKNLPLPEQKDVLAILIAGKTVPVVPDDSPPEKALTSTRKPTEKRTSLSVPKTPTSPALTTLETPPAKIPGQREPIYRIRTERKDVFRGGDEESLRRVAQSNPKWQFKGIAFYGMPNDVPGAVPLYRYTRSGGRHTYLVGDQEPADGFRKEGEGHPMTWIWETEKVQTVPLYLLGASGRDVRTLAIGKPERDRLMESGNWRQNRLLGFVYESKD